MAPSSPPKDSRQRVCVVFVDGLGVGQRDPRRNPLAAAQSQLLALYEDELPCKELPLGGIAVGLDASLSVAGIPQSATGQTALFAGVNAARLLGSHYPGFPNRILRRVLFERSLLRVARQKGIRAAFVNAYTRLADGKSFEDLLPRVSASTMACLSAGQPFRTLDDLRAKRAVYQDFTNRQLVERGHDVPIWSPKEAGAVLAEVSAGLDLCLYEFFRTDRVGHKQDLERAEGVIFELEEFLSSFLKHVDLHSQLVLVVSDHGNVEDITFGGHTANRAFAAGWGDGARELVLGWRSLLDFYPGLLRHFGINPQPWMSGSAEEGEISP
ncbi:MAG: peptidase [candidate division KSB1 bacterium]|nr:peptidase [candidate division KSB1 bacterium]